MSTSRAIVLLRSSALGAADVDIGRWNVRIQDTDMLIVRDAIDVVVEIISLWSVDPEDGAALS